jgi:hypothetical protein
MAEAEPKAARVAKPGSDAIGSLADPAALAERTEPGARRRWHQALGFALTGRRLDALGRQQQPNLAQFLNALESIVGRDAIVQHKVDARNSGGSWPHQVPADLMEGIGYAQFAAVLAQVIASFPDDRSPVAAARAATTQPVTPCDRRLLDEVPPHHGS